MGTVLNIVNSIFDGGRGRKGTHNQLYLEGPMHMVFSFEFAYI